MLQRRTVSLLNVCQLRCAQQLLAEHDVEKIKTIRPLNTSLNPARKQTRQGVGGGGGGETKMRKNGFIRGKRESCLLLLIKRI